MSKVGKESLSVKKNVSEVSASSVKKKTSKTVVEKTGVVQISEFRSLNVGDMRSSSLKKEVGGGVSDLSISSSVVDSKKTGASKNVKSSKSKTVSKKVEGKNFITSGATIVKAKFESDSKKESLDLVKSTTEDVVTEKKVFGEDAKLDLISNSENTFEAMTAETGISQRTLNVIGNENVGTSLVLVDSGEKTAGKISSESIQNGITSQTMHEISCSSKEEVMQSFQMNQKLESVAVMSGTKVISDGGCIEINTAKSGSDSKIEKNEIIEKSVVEAHSEKSSKVSQNIKHVTDKMIAQKILSEKKTAASFSGEQCICEICTCG